MEEDYLQKTDRASDPMRHSSEGRKEAPKGLGWIVWVLAVMVAFLLASNIANLVVSRRAYENALEQVKAVERLTQSIKDIQRSIDNLSRMIEQSPQEYEEPEEESEQPSGAGSI